MASHKNEVWIHIVFSTKHRARSIPQEIEKELYQQFIKILARHRCYVAAINGMADHVHIFIKTNLRRDMCTIIGQVKGYSSYWLNRHPMMKGPFAWQKGFAAFSVDGKYKHVVIRYISNQKSIHAHRERKRRRD